MALRAAGNNRFEGESWRVKELRFRVHTTAIRGATSRAAATISRVSVATPDAHLHECLGCFPTGMKSGSRVPYQPSKQQSAPFSTHVPDLGGKR